MPRSQPQTIAAELGPITQPDCTTFQVASDDENVPGLPLGASALRPPFGSLEPSPDSDAASREGKRHPKCRLPRRRGVGLVAPSSQRARTDSQVAREEGDAEFRERRKINPWDFSRSTSVGDSDLQNASRLPLERWPSYEIIFPLGHSALAVEHPIFASGPRGKPPSETLIREEDDDPLSAALEAPEAEMTPPAHPIFA